MRRAVFFDLDDTIFDHQHCRRAGLRALTQAYPAMAGHDLRALEALHERHLQITHYRVLAGELSMTEARRERLRAFFAELKAPMAAAELDRADAIYRPAYRAARRAVPGAVALIEALRPRAKLGIITNGLVRAQEEKLRDCGVAGKFDAVIISETVGINKPDRAIFEIALQALGVTADEAVVIGDSWRTDVVGALHAGMPAVWVNRYEEACPEPGCAGVMEVAGLEPSERLVQILEGM